jgi:hypothetical protein
MKRIQKQERRDLETAVESLLTEMSVAELKVATHRALKHLRRSLPHRNGES